MTTISIPWIDHELKKLHPYWRIRWRLFEPSPAFWNWLSTGEAKDLTRATYELGQHVNLSTIPQAEYVWSMFMTPEHAGTIQNMGTIRSRIHIPFAYVGIPYAVGAILAHELAHQQLTEARISYPDVLENEKLTDLAAIANGLGKLVLAGLSQNAQPNGGERANLGYITADEKLYAYQFVCRQYGITRLQMRANLPDDVMELLD